MASKPPSLLIAAGRTEVHTSAQDTYKLPSKYCKVPLRTKGDARLLIVHPRAFARTLCPHPDGNAWSCTAMKMVGVC